MRRWTNTINLEQCRTPQSRSTASARYDLLGESSGTTSPVVVGTYRAITTSAMARVRDPPCTAVDAFMERNVSLACLPAGFRGVLTDIVK